MDRRQGSRIALTTSIQLFLKTIGYQTLMNSVLRDYVLHRMND
jgi:hypothetical protein